MDELLLHTEVWMNVTCVISSERSQLEKYNHTCDSIFMVLELMIMVIFQKGIMKAEGWGESGGASNALLLYLVILSLWITHQAIHLWYMNLYACYTSLKVFKNLCEAVNTMFSGKLSLLNLCITNNNIWKSVSWTRS